MIHLIGLPHTQFDGDEFSICAFTGKAVRLAAMLRSVDREVTVYWGGDKADVSLLSVDEQSLLFGENHRTLLPVVEWIPNHPHWVEFNRRAVVEVGKRLSPGDIIALVSPCSQSVADSYPSNTACEPGVGYEGIGRDTWLCFDSYAWMHNRYGYHGIGDGRYFDTAILNAVDPAEWSMGDSDGYALFVGRLIHRKGPHLAAQIAKAAGLPLVMAGAGVKSARKGRIEATDGTLITGDVEHVGPVFGDDRRELFTHAEVFICPTLYIGPGEYVHSEAMMSGVGVVAPDFGVFTETLPRQARFRTLREANVAVSYAQMRRGSSWRNQAIDQFGIARAAVAYDDWFDRLDSLRDGRNGFYSPS